MLLADVAAQWLGLPTEPGTRFRGLCTRVTLASDEPLLWPAWWFVQASASGPVYAHEGGARLYPDDIGDAELIRGLRVIPDREEAIRG
jgi:hypothetical protein